MQYQVKVTQTTYKFISVEAENEYEALEKAQTMAEEGEIHFDDEPFLEMELNVDIVNEVRPVLSQRSL